MHEYITFYRQDISKCCARLFINRESVRSLGAQSQKGRLKYDLKLAGGGVNYLCTVRYSVDNVMNFFRTICCLLSQEARTTHQRQLASNERQCKSYLTFANETVDMMHYLTKEAREPFLKAVRSLFPRACY